MSVHKFVEKKSLKVMFKKEKALKSLKYFEFLSVHWCVFSTAEGDTISTLRVLGTVGRYHQYFRGIPSVPRLIFSAMERNHKHFGCYFPTFFLPLRSQKLVYFETQFCNNNGCVSWTIEPHLIAKYN